MDGRSHHAMAALQPSPTHGLQDMRCRPQTGQMCQLCKSCICGRRQRQGKRARAAVEEQLAIWPSGSCFASGMWAWARLPAASTECRSAQMHSNTLSLPDDVPFVPAVLPLQCVFKPATGRSECLVSPHGTPVPNACARGAGLATSCAHPAHRQFSTAIALNGT